MYRWVPLVGCRSGCENFRRLLNGQVNWRERAFVDCSCLRLLLRVNYNTTLELCRPNDVFVLPLNFHKRKKNEKSSTGSGPDTTGSEPVHSLPEASGPRLDTGTGEFIKTQLGEWAGPGMLQGQFGKILRMRSTIVMVQGTAEL